MRAIFIGRMNPLTNGHVRAIKVCEEALNIPVTIGLTENKHSKVGYKNPLTWDERKSLISAVMDNEVIKVSGHWAEDLIEDDVVFCVGEDQRGMMQNISKSLPNLCYYIVPRPKESESSTKLKKVLVDGDYESYKGLVPVELLDKFEWLKDKVKEQ